VTHAAWPGTARTPEPRTPAVTDLTRADVLRAVAREFALLAAALLGFGGMLLLIQHVGSVP
jgi:hypothetical protein